jgi:hypothetical protein
MGTKKRVRTTLCFDPDVLKKAKSYVKRKKTSVSLWIEQLMEPHL